jgi:hypothetical protein
LNEFARERLRPLAPGIVLGLLAIALGFGMGAAFGVSEDSLKAGLATSGEAVLDSAYGGDRDAMTKVVKKSWQYYKRAHLHANALGTTAIACTLLLALLGTPGWRERIAAGALGGGALLYGTFWLLAGSMAPGLGGTGAAKEALSFVAIPGSGLCMIGLALTIWSVVASTWFAPTRSDD